MDNILVTEYDLSPHENNGKVELGSSQIEGKTIYWADLSTNRTGEGKIFFTNEGISVITYGPTPDTFVGSYCTEGALGTVTSLNGKRIECNYNQSGRYPWIQLPLGYEFIHAPRDPINAAIAEYSCNKPKHSIHSIKPVYPFLRMEQKQPLCSGPPDSRTWHVLTYYLQCKPLRVRYTGIDSLQEDNNLPGFLRRIMRWHDAMVGIAPRIEEVSRDELDKLFHYSRVSGANSR